MTEAHRSHGDLVERDRMEVDFRAGTVTVNGRTVPFSDPQGFAAIADLWLRAGWDARYVYGFTWLGRPIIQLPDDMLALQELFFRIRPDVLIEIGIAHGGSLIFYASLCHLLGKGRVVGVDVEIRPANRSAIESHEMFPRITLIEGDSIAPDTVKEVRKHVPAGSTVMVVLDGLHTCGQVLEELRLYSPLVTPGSIIVAMDGIMERVAGAARTGSDWATNNPQKAVERFLAEDRSFELLAPAPLFNEGSPGYRPTYFPRGVLRRKP